MAFKELGFETINRAISDLETMGHVDSPPKLVGRNINTMISPLPANKRKPKYYVRREAGDAAEEEIVIEANTDEVEDEESEEESES